MAKKLLENIWKFLNDDLPNAYDDLDIFLLQDKVIKKLWDESRDKIMASWISKHPGTRPLLWWRFDSSGDRERIGGKGQMTWEKWPSVMPTFEKGTPSSWAEIDPDDPPRFESEAAYLLRHDLLSAQEKKYLVSHPELMEPEKIVFDGNEINNNP
jgi:hypothetical protein